MISKIIFLLNGLIFFILIGSSKAVDNHYIVCGEEASHGSCEQLTRHDSEVRCQWVQDSIECAQSILNKTADFGIFSAESILQLAILEWDRLSVITPFAHKERRNEQADFASIAIVRKGHNGGLEGLKGKKYCHPGFSGHPNERWTERFLKHFERKVVLPKCSIGKSAAALETEALSEYFGDSCRPGIWSYDEKEDAELKKKYKSLCKLCPKSSDCKYDDKNTDNSHQKALKCLRDGGDVAYVSLLDAQLFFNSTADVNKDDFEYLCENGSTLPIQGTVVPCVWLRQPWKAIITRSDVDRDMSGKIEEWVKKGADGVTWHYTLKKVLKIEDYEIASNRHIKSPRDYFDNYRPIPRKGDSICNTHISWCTVSERERRKCEIAQAGGISVGVYPEIECRAPVDTEIQCLDDIYRNVTDFTGIDSNYGWLARSNFNLTAALYFHTEESQFSTLVVVIKESSKIQNFSSLRGKQACLPEYGSTPAIALINELKNRNILDKKACNYGKMLKDFFGDSCFPGAQDWKYVQTHNASFTSLCNLCFKAGGNNGGNGDLATSIETRNNQRDWQNTPMSTCAANRSNRYFGNRGALKCLNEVGDVAVLELQSLKRHAEEVELDENNFTMLCRNNSLAKSPGFDHDLDCALTTIVDGEIIMYRKSPKASSVVHVLLALEHYFTFKSDPSFKIYNIFEGERNLLFKDSTIGLTHPDAVNQGEKVVNYKKLFRDVERCAGSSAVSISKNILSTIFIMFFASLLNHLGKHLD